MGGKEAKAQIVGFGEEAEEAELVAAEDILVGHEPQGVGFEMPQWNLKIGYWGHS